MGTEPRLLSRRQCAWLLAAAAGSTALQAAYMPPWLIGGAATMLALRAWLLAANRALLPRYLVMLMVGTGIIGVAAHYRTVFGQQAGSALLVVFLALKTMELRRPRDGLAVVFLCYFLHIAVFFNTQSPGAAALVAANLVLVTAALISISHDRGHAVGLLRQSALLLLQALPVMAALFVLFPRMSGPLWGVHVGARAANTGLSETMTPGSISALSLSGAIAFRAEFAGPVPAPAQLYWRGPVLTHYDGRTWSPIVLSGLRELPYTTSGPAFDYSVTLEATDRPWLLALDLPGLVPPEAVMTRDHQLVARRAITVRTRHSMRSYPDTVAGGSEAPEMLAAALALPPRANPRTRELAERWRAQSGDAQALAQRVLAWFRAEEFIYTLTPPLLEGDAVDQFLFATRRGFCEHYAAAFVFLMRAAGVPARVVTGYQGGEINTVDGHLVVRQSDAHAWAEIWIAGRGWLRVDPTAAIAPSRIERGLAAALPESEPVPLLIRADLDWLRPLRDRVESLSYAWNLWVLGYNLDRQRQLLSRLGMPAPDWRSLVVWLMAASGLIVLVLAALTLRERAAADPACRLWNRLSKKLARRGLARQPWEGPMDYARRVGAARPALAEPMMDIARLYAGLRYGARAEPDMLENLRRSIRRLPT